MNQFFRKNSLLFITLAIIVVLFLAASRGMTSQDFVITLLRGLSVGSVTFLVASGFSLVFGLLDVLNLAHGTLFMIGAYIAWTVFVRPDTFVDLVSPVLFILSGFALRDLWIYIHDRFHIHSKFRRILPWILIAISVFLFVMILPKYAIALWNLGNYAQSPVTYSFMANQGTRLPPVTAMFETISPGLAIVGLLAASMLGAFALSLFGQPVQRSTKLTWRNFILFGVLLIIGLTTFIFNDWLTNVLLGIDSIWLFLIALVVATMSGVGLGALMEATLIRPLYSRPIYQLMLTVGLSSIGVEIVQAIWGRPEFVMPKASLFNNAGTNCPATSLADWWQNHCSTIFLLNGRVRVYDDRDRRSGWNMDFAQADPPGHDHPSRRPGSRDGGSPWHQCAPCFYPRFRTGRRFGHIWRRHCGAFDGLIQFNGGKPSIERFDRPGNRRSDELPWRSPWFFIGRVDPAIYHQIRPDWNRHPLHAGCV